MSELRIWSPAFSDGGMIPAKYTCDGDDVNPPLKIENVPPGAKSLVLIVEDPDAPSGLFVHWTMWNIPTHTGEIGENSVPREAIAGKNDFHRNSYGGPCPPSGTHRYLFRVAALDTTLDLAGGVSKNLLEEAMDRHVLATATLTGRYTRTEK